jgi:hypothetical protein
MSHKLKPVVTQRLETFVMDSCEWWGGFCQFLWCLLSADSMILVVDTLKRTVSVPYLGAVQGRHD